MRSQRDIHGDTTLASAGDLLTALRRYLAVIAIGKLVWEFLQLPLYTIWYKGSSREIIFAVLHCTGGDILIATTVLLATLIIIATGSWPRGRYAIVAETAILGGIAYTILSEWLNTEIRGSWAYTDLMPQLPLIGTGIAPLVQWIIVPAAAFWWAYRPFAAQFVAKSIEK